MTAVREEDESKARRQDKWWDIAIYMGYIRRYREIDRISKAL